MCVCDVILDRRIDILLSPCVGRNVADRQPVQPREVTKEPVKVRILYI